MWTPPTTTTTGGGRTRSQKTGPAADSPERGAPAASAASAKDANSRAGGPGSSEPGANPRTDGAPPPRATTDSPARSPSVTTA